jgi:integrase
LVRRWEDSRRPAPLRPRPGCCVRDVCAAYLDFARQRYRTPAGERTSEYASYKVVMGDVLDKYAGLPACAFGADQLEALVADWVERGLSRRTVNLYSRRVKTLFRWAAHPRRKLVPAEVVASLAYVESLEPGRTDAPDYPDVAPAPEASVAAVVAAGGPVAGLVAFQRYTGCRPGEACRARAGEVECHGPLGCWVFRPVRHKTQRRRQVAYALGPRARALVGPLLGAGPDALLFPRNGGRAWGVKAYAYALGRECRQLGVEGFNPNRLRHSFLTEVAATFDVETARAAVMHGNSQTTLTYIAQDLTKAAAVAEKIG